MSFTVGSLFCGIGGFCFGFEAAGFRTLWANDWDDDAIATYRNNFPEVDAICGDLRALNNEDYPFAPVDVLHAGFPCQSFSQAGNRLGFKDERGQLFFEIMKLLKRLGPNKPKILLFENSPYIAIGEGGLWFDTIRSEIQRAGYWFSEHNAVLIDSRKNAGLPQRRERLFMVATSQDHLRLRAILTSDRQAVRGERPGEEARAWSRVSRPFRHSFPNVIPERLTSSRASPPSSPAASPRPLWRALWLQALA